MQKPTIPRPHATPLRTTLLIAMVLVASTACVEAFPTDIPLASEAGPDRNPLDAAAVLIGIDDARLRIVPALGERATAETLSVALAELSSVLAVGDRPMQWSALGAARRALDGYGKAAGADEAELDAIRLALEAVAVIRSAAADAGSAVEPNNTNRR